MADIYEQDATVKEETSTREDLEKKAAQWMHLWALAQDRCGDSYFAKGEAITDLFELGYELRRQDPPDDRSFREDWERVGAATPDLRGSFTKNPGTSRREIRRPCLATRRQAEAAAGVLVEAYESVGFMRCDELLNVGYEKEGPLGAAIQSLEHQFMQVMLELGRVLRQEDDLLQVGETTEARWFTGEEIEDMDGKPAIGVIQ